MPVEITREGRCECHTEPLNGAGGLEGYNRGSVYRFQLCKGPKERYYRVYHDHPLTPPDYYETCGPMEFLSYFREVLPCSTPSAGTDDSGADDGRR
jgi:hypothetical protein